MFGPLRNAVIWAQIRNDYGEIVIVGMSAGLPSNSRIFQVLGAILKSGRQAVLN